MKSELLRELFSVKLKIAGELIRCLPAPLQSRVDTLNRAIIRAIRDATEGYLREQSDDDAGKAEKGVENIPIE
ncbi:MAG: hypothetical protein JW913_10450 [Chitinispirillaceae bacterium]|nr:hypothetical protein [Chitinispirillaceae bacterium]